MCDYVLGDRTCFDAVIGDINKLPERSNRGKVKKVDIKSVVKTGKWCLPPR